MKFLEKIFANQVVFEKFDDSEKFVKTFTDLYRINLFKDGLDLILSKMQEKALRFEVRIVKGWDTNVGCFLTEKKTVFDKTLGKFFHHKDLKIILRQLSHNVMAHEMAHALEFESGINLGEEFRQAIGFDMKDRSPSNIALKAEIQRLMVEALKSYPPHQFLSELFARYFELLSISRDVRMNGNFTTQEVMSFFENTSNFLSHLFNPTIRAKINPEIAKFSTDLLTKINSSKQEKTFQDQVDSRKKLGSWSSSTKSNSAWLKGWQKHEELEDKKKS